MTCSGYSLQIDTLHGEGARYRPIQDVQFFLCEEMELGYNEDPERYKQGNHDRKA